MHTVEESTRAETLLEPPSGEDTISERFDYVAARLPARTALTCNGTEVIYHYASAAANRLAGALLQELGPGNEPVVILQNHDTPVLISVLGVLRAGKIYTVLEPDVPAARLKTIISDLGVRALVSAGRNMEVTKSVIPDGCSMIDMDRLADDLEFTLAAPQPAADSLAAIYYTSGSTGSPKGVMWTHRGIMQRIHSDTGDYNIDSEDRFALLFSCSFGASVSNIFNALLNGASVRLFDVRSSSLGELTEWLVRESITMLHIPVALFRQWLASLEPSDYFPALRQVAPAGRLYRKDVLRLWTHVPTDCQLIHRFSTSETGMCTRVIIERDTALGNTVIPIGFPVDGMDVRIVGEDGRPIDPGESGEIRVKGRHMSLGYWGKPELTQQRFRASLGDPYEQEFRTGDIGRSRPDGSLEYIGRHDSMVKIRGYRVEPAEVEVALEELDGIQQAVVVPDAVADDETVLVAFVVPEPNRQIQCDIAMGCLRKSLPSYMVPKSLVILETLPLTATGKVDRRALGAFDVAAPTGTAIAPRSELELALIGIWESCLGVSPLGIHDDFIELGGDSLKALAAVSEIRRKTGLKLSIAQLVETPTIAMLTEALSLNTATPSGELPIA